MRNIIQILCSKNSHCSLCHAFLQDPVTFPLRFCPMLAWMHHIISAVLSVFFFFFFAIFRSTTSQSCSADFRVRSVVTDARWTHCHVDETSLRWLLLRNTVHYPAGGDDQMISFCISSNLLQVCVKRRSIRQGGWICVDTGRSSVSSGSSSGSFHAFKQMMRSGTVVSCRSLNHTYSPPP